MDAERKRAHGGGRKPLSTDYATVRVTVTLTQDDADLLAQMDKTASAAVRALLRQWRAANTQPDSNFISTI